MAPFRRPVRSRPIRVFLIGMLAVPLVSLLALWGFAASITVNAAIKDQTYNSSSKTTNAGVYWLLSGGRAPQAPMLAARKLVNQAVPPARTALIAIEGTRNPVLSTLITDLN